MNNQLSCNATTCVHNMSGLCSASSIHVIGSGAFTSSQTMCNTFSEKGFRNAVTNLTNMNVVGEIKQIFTNSSIEMSPAIKCEAMNCQYNSNRLCSANNVQINGPDASASEGTQCQTFRK